MGNFVKVCQSLGRRYRHLILYGIIGGCTAFLDFCVFTLLSRVLGVYYILANCVSIAIGITASFILNRTYNFKVKDHAGRRFVIFLTVGIGGMMLSNGILYAGIALMQQDETAIKLASILIVAFFQFLLNKFITFKQSD